MNFLFITYQFPPEIGGTKTRILNYIKNVVSMGFRTTVIVLEHRKDIKAENFFGASVYRCPFSIRHFFKVFILGKMIIRRCQIDIVHVYTGANIPFGLIFLIYGRFKGLKTGVSLFGTEIQRTRKVFVEYLVLLLALFLSDRIGANSRATLKMVPRVFSHKIKILYAGVDPSILETVKEKPQLVSKRKWKGILYVGRLSTVKGVTDLLHAFKLILERVPDARLAIVGEGIEENNLRDIARKTNVSNRVAFMGALTGEKLFDQYQKCDVFVMPSKTTKNGVFETFGIVFLEAALFRKPSVGTWSGGIPEAVIHGRTGLLVPEGDVNSLADAIVKILTNRKLAERLGQQAYKRAIRRFTWREATKDLEDMYTQ